MKNIELYSAKIGWDAKNKEFLIRIYPHLYHTMAVKESPRWSDVIKSMLPANSTKQNLSSYYSSIRRCLKDIDVVYYSKPLKKLVKGKNYNRFFSPDVDWSWFICRTGSLETSEVILHEL